MLPRFLSLVLLVLLALAGPAAAAPVNKPTPGYVRVRLVTSAGPIVVAVDTRRAPKTSANFLAYVDDGRFDGTTIYRAARRQTAPRYGFIQGGIGTDARRALPPVALEPTDETGLKHLDAMISMARNAQPNSGGGNFFLTVGATPNMDARGAYRGYAAFGHIVQGMDVVRKILAMPTGGGKGAMRGQMILETVHLIRAERVDGQAKPTGGVKPWLLKIRPPEPPRR